MYIHDFSQKFPQAGILFFTVTVYHVAKPTWSRVKPGHLKKNQNFGTVFDLPAKKQSQSGPILVNFDYLAGKLKQSPWYSGMSQSLKIWGGGAAPPPLPTCLMYVRRYVGRAENPGGEYLVWVQNLMRRALPPAPLLQTSLKTSK